MREEIRERARKGEGMDIEEGDDERRKGEGSGSRRG